MKPEDWLLSWRGLLGISESFPSWVVVIAALFLVHFPTVLGVGYFFSFFERKFSADFHARVGPHRTGPSGILQPLADILKLLQKQKSPRAKEAWGFLLVFFFTLGLSVAVLPIGSRGTLVDTEMSAFIPLLVAAVSGLALLGAQLKMKSVVGWLGALRLATQTVTGIVPALICLMTAGFAAGTLRWEGLVVHQGANPLHWTAFRDPFSAISALVFLVSGLVMFGLPPFENPIQGGVKTGYLNTSTGNEFGLLKFARFYCFFLWMLITVVLFFGGWAMPASISQSLKGEERWVILFGLEYSALLVKVLICMSGTVWISSVNPRVRSDQVSALVWKVLMPLALIALLGSVTVKAGIIWIAAH